MMEQVQRLATRMILRRCGKPKMEYDERLKELGLQTLTERRKEADIKLFNKILTGATKCDLGIEIKTTQTRRQSQVVRPRTKKKTRENFFKCRIHKLINPTEAAKLTVTTPE